eukprot:1276134-Amphidinium_carterae.1
MNQIRFSHVCYNGTDTDRLHEQPIARHRSIRGSVYGKCSNVLNTCLKGLWNIIPATQATGAITRVCCTWFSLRMAYQTRGARVKCSTMGICMVCDGFHAGRAEPESEIEAAGSMVRS